MICRRVASLTSHVCVDMVLLLLLLLLLLLNHRPTDRDNNYCHALRHFQRIAGFAITLYYHHPAGYFFLLNIYFITSVGVQVCDRRPSVRRVLWLTMHNKLLQD
jgi:hypothetical protein